MALNNYYIIERYRGGSVSPFHVASSTQIELTERSLQLKSTLPNLGLVNFSEKKTLIDYRSHVGNFVFEHCVVFVFSFASSQLLQTSYCRDYFDLIVRQWKLHYFQFDFLKSKYKSMNVRIG